MTFANMKIDLRDRLTILSTSTLITTTMLARWLNQAKDICLVSYRWPFLQKKSTDLIDATGTYSYPSGIRTKSIYLITVDGERYVKIAYEDYLKYLEEYSTGKDRVWAEFDRDVYINGNACSVGETINMYGYEKVADLSSDSDTTPFDAAEPSGDEAIIRRAVAVGMRKIGGLDNEALIEEREAKEILETIWARIQEAKPREVRKGRQLFRRIDILKGTTSESSESKVGRFE